MSTIGIIKFFASISFAAVILKIILPARGVAQLEIDEFRSKLKEDSILFIDVRNPAQYHQFHIYKFKNIPLRDIRSQAKQLEKDQEIVVICQTGAKGNAACKRLKRRGFTNLANVRGGLSMWDPVHIDRS